MCTHELFMRRAIELSKKGIRSHNGGPFGAVIVRDGEVIAEGNNCVTSQNDPTLHAEIVAIRRACAHIGSFDLTECVLYTSCEPCPMCLGAVYWSRIKEVYYANTKNDAASIGFDDAFIYEELDRDRAKRALPMIQIMRNEAVGVFHEWENMKDKITY